MKHVPEFDDSALKKMEAEMAKKFSEKVNKETRNSRMTRQKEQAEHNVVELSRGNELYDKGDYLAALCGDSDLCQWPVAGRRWWRLGEE